MFGKPIKLYRYRVNCDRKHHELFKNLGDAIRKLNETWNELSDDVKATALARDTYYMDYTIALVEISYGYSSMPSERNIINMIYTIKDSIELGLVK